MPIRMGGKPPESGAEVDAVLVEIRGLDEPYAPSGRETLVYWFEVTDPKHKNWKASVATDTFMRPEVRGGRVAAEVLGRDIDEEDDDLETALAECVNQPYKITVTHHRAEDGLKLNVRKIRRVYHQGA